MPTAARTSAAAANTPRRIARKRDGPCVASTCASRVRTNHMTGHKLVRFSQAERDNLRRFGDAGGLLFSDDCNHDVNGLFAKSFEQEMQRTFPENPLAKLPSTHAIYRSFFPFGSGPPQTSHELNGWGDNIVHDYLKGIERRGRLAVLYSNKDYGCEWDYDWRNKRFLREDNTKFAVNVVVYVMA